MSTFGNTVERKSRQERQCEGCGGIIPAHGRAGGALGPSVVFAERFDLVISRGLWHQTTTLYNGVD
jgi:hypothetical protein